MASATTRFSNTDFASVVACIGVVICLCNMQREPFIIGAIIVSLAVSLTLALAAQRGMPTARADTPWFSVTYLIFWTVLLKVCAR